MKGNAANAVDSYEPAEHNAFWKGQVLTLKFSTKLKSMVLRGESSL